MNNEQSIFLHEIKNNLSNIYSLVELMENDNMEITECIPLIKTSILNIKYIEQDYDNYRKTGKYNISLHYIFVDKLIDAVCSKYKIEADKYGIQLIHDCPNIRIKTDGNKLQQVLNNLVSNGIKYNKPKGIVYIQFKEYKEYKKYSIIVSDTGIGMSSIEIKKLGSPFYRCKKVNTPGSGLGISLVKKITKLMGWEYIITSKPIRSSNYTTTIIINIPFN